VLKKKRRRVSRDCLFLYSEPVGKERKEIVALYHLVPLKGGFEVEKKKKGRGKIAYLIYPSFLRRFWKGREGGRKGEKRLLIQKQKKEKGDLRLSLHPFLFFPGEVDRKNPSFYHLYGSLRGCAAQEEKGGRPALLASSFFFYLTYDHPDGGERGKKTRRVIRVFLSRRRPMGGAEKLLDLPIPRAAIGERKEERRRGGGRISLYLPAPLGRSRREMKGEGKGGRKRSSPLLLHFVHQAYIGKKGGKERRGLIFSSFISLTFTQKKERKKERRGRYVHYYPLFSSGRSKEKRGIGGGIIRFYPFYFLNTREERGVGKRGGDVAVARRVAALCLRSCTRASDAERGRKKGERRAAVCSSFTILSRTETRDSGTEREAAGAASTTSGLYRDRVRTGSKRMKKEKVPTLYSDFSLPPSQSALERGKRRLEGGGGTKKKRERPHGVGASCASGLNATIEKRLRERKRIKGRGEKERASCLIHESHSLRLSVMVRIGSESKKGRRKKREGEGEGRCERYRTIFILLCITSRLQRYPELT